MASKSNIEWTGHTWNPIAGCTVLTPGCTNCYAMKMAARLEAMGQELYAGLTKPSKGGAVWTGKTRAAPLATVLAPLRRQKATTYFVNSMSDLFHEGVPDEGIDFVFAVMALGFNHTFQVLTKRSERMQRYMDDVYTPERIWPIVVRLIQDFPDRYCDWMGSNRALQAWFSNNITRAVVHKDRRPRPEPGRKLLPWPLPNVWLGVSVERQKEADERIPYLLATPAAIRFISAEPLLGPIYLGAPDDHDNVLDWVIVGGESGPNARPMNPAWARSLRDQCEAMQVAFFFKQHGEYRVEPTNQYRDKEHVFLTKDWDYVRLGKKAAGRLLDGRTWDEMPGGASA